MIQQKLVFSKHQDWGESPDILSLYGRSPETSLLRRWFNEEPRKLIAVWGRFGTGKTALTAKVAKDIQQDFDYIIWRNLDWIHSFNQLLTELISFFSHQQETDLPKEPHQCILLLIQYLQQHRCLVILDNWQTVFKRKFPQHYHELLQKVAQVSHQSCLVIISNVKPKEIELLEEKFVGILPLEGLGEAAKNILKAKRLLDEKLWDRLIDDYRGNPRDLKLVAKTIKEIYGGSVEAYFNNMCNTLCNVIVDESFKEELNRQLKSLSPVERDIMVTLAVKEQSVSLQQLREAHTKVYRSEITRALESLLERSLIEKDKHEQGFCFQLSPVIQKQITREYLPVTIPPQPNIEVSATPQQALAKPTQPSPSLTSLPADQLIQPVHPWIKLGGLLTVGTVFLLFFLSAFIPFNITVKGKGEVRPVGERRRVEAVIEGKIEVISTKEGKKVKKGDILATINDFNLQTAKIQYSARIERDKFQLKQVEKDINTYHIRKKAETERLDREIAEAKASLGDRQNTSRIQVEEAITNLELKNFDLVEAEIDLVDAELNLNLANKRLSRYRKVVRVLSQNEMEEAELELRQRQQKVSQVTEVVARCKQLVKAAETKLINARKAAQPQADKITIARESLERAIANKKSTLAKLDLEKSALIQQKNDISSQIQDTKRELEKVTQDLENTKIKAIEDGIIFKNYLRNPSLNVKPGTLLFEIIPQDGALEIKANVTPQDRNYLDEGQKVHMKVDSCSYTDYGTLKGKVTYISGDKILSEENGIQNSFFEVTIEPETTVLKSEGQEDCPIILGLQGEVDIIAKEVTVLKRLLQQMRLIANL